MSSIRLGKEQYTELLEYLKQFWPESLMIYSLVKRLQRGVFKDFIVWVDRWPEPEAVVANADQDICKIPCWKIFVVAFEKNPSSFLSLVLEVDRNALENNMIRVFSGISQETTELLQKTFPNRQCQINEAELLWLKSREDKKVERCKLPEGFHVGTMTEALSEAVVEQATEWKGYLEPIALYNAAVIYDCPYAAVYDKDGVPVGWFLQHCVLGSLNHLFVLPEFRDRGIGKFLIEQISEAALKKDGYAFIQIKKNMSWTSIHLGQEHYTELLDYLQSFWPKSLMVYSTLRNLQRGLPIGFNVWTDKWPAPEAIIMYADEDKCPVDCWKSYVMMFETVPSRLSSLLPNVVLNSERSLFFPGLSPGTLKQVKSAFPNKKFRSLECGNIMWVRPHDFTASSSGDLPDKIHKGTMTKEISEQVVTNAHQDWGTFVDASSIFQSASSYHSPHVVITDENDVPIGWFMQHVILGSLNYLHVQPEYRGRGLGKNLVSILSKEVLGRDGVAFIHVSPDNKVSVKIHEDAGYINAGAFSFSIMLPE